MSWALPSVPLNALESDDPRELGDYRLLGRLGAGGMGIAYLAEGPGGWAVVKTIWPHLRGDSAYRARLARELDAMRSAASSHVAAVLDQDLSGASPWFAMEFVPGVTLQRRVEESGALPGREVHELAAGLAQAVASTSAVGVVHRDLKPANVMMSPDGPRLIDFGIADLSDATALTSTGVVVGSAGWMAPEQITGGEVSSAADVHAWGLCVLFAATGAAPFTGDNTTATIYQVLHTEPDVPASLGEPLGPLVRASLAKQADARPRADELARSLASGPVGSGTTVLPVASTAVGVVEAPPLPAVEQHSDRRRSGGRAVLIGAVAALLVLALAGVGLALGRSSGSTAAPDAPRASSASPTPAVTVTRTATVEPAPLATPSKAPASTAASGAPRTATPARIPGSAVSARSTCPNSFGLTGADLLVDGDTNSGWRCDNRPDNAEGIVNSAPTVGESVVFSFARPYTISAIDIDEGASGSAFRWCENGRLRMVTWDFGDGQAPEASVLPDRVDLPSNLFLRTDLTQPRTTQSVTMTVDEIYPAGSVCTENGETGRPWEYGPTAKPSEIRFIGVPA